MSIELDDIVQDHEKRISEMEVNSARLDERLNALVSSTNNLKIGMWVFSAIMLLTMVYQILGKEGYREVTQTISPVAPMIQQAN